MRKTVVGAVFLGLGFLVGGVAAPGGAAAQSSSVLDLPAAAPAQQCSAPAPELFGGFDHFGYTFADSREPGGAAYSWVEISGTGTAVALGDDEVSADIPIGFSFPFYGVNQTTLRIASNGFLGFGGLAVSDFSDLCGVDAAPPNNIIALMWDDLNPGPTADQVYYQSFESCPVGGGACFVVQYQDFHHFFTSWLTVGPVAGTFEAILYADGRILLQYADVGTEAGLEATVGIENAAGSDGLIYSCNEAILADGLAIRYSPAWRQRRDLPASLARYGRAQCAGDPESFYVISGVSGGTLTPEAKRYNALTNTWTVLAPFPGGAGAGLEGAVAVCVKDAIYVAGGGATGEFHRYNIATNTWTALASVPRTFWGAAIGAWGGKVFVAGGGQFGPGESNQVDIYDIATNTWTGTGAAMPVAAKGVGCAQSGRYLFVVGGWDAGSPTANVSAVQRYDMQNDEWTLGPAFTSARADLALAITQDHLYAIGGDANAGGWFDAATTVERLDCRNWPIGAWEPAPSLTVPVTGITGGFSTNHLGGGEVWAAGGITAGFGWLPTNQYLKAQRSSFLATNASFEAGTKVPKWWRGSRLGATDGRTRVQKKFGSYALQMVGTTAVKTLAQSVPLAGAASDTFILSGWSRANKPSPRGLYELSAKVLYADGTSQVFKVGFTKRTHNWEYKERTFVVGKDYVGVDVTVTYGRNAGVAWFDGVQLVRQ